MALAPAAKRLRTDENSGSSGNVSDGVNLRMNRRISLSCYSVAAGHSAGVQPTFTHQAFDDERLRVPCMEATDIKVRVAWTEDRLLHLAHVCPPKGFESVGAAALERLKAVLPEDFCCSEETFAARARLEGQSPFRAPGELVRRYERDGRRFRMQRCRGGAGEGALHAYHQRAQKLAYWFIETADDIDVSDDRWEVLYTFEEKGGGALCLVGYQTLFRFRNPFKGDILRVCQSLVLPWHQRCGHGRELLEAALRQALEDADVAQLTVEDPCDAFCSLRDAVDARHLLSSGHAPAALTAYLSARAAARAAPGDAERLAEALEKAAALIATKKAELRGVAAALKLTVSQVSAVLDAVAFTALKLRREHDPEDERALRLAAKRRLFRKHRAELNAMERKADRHDFLEDKYACLFERSRRLQRTVLAALPE